MLFLLKLTHKVNYLPIVQHHNKIQLDPVLLLVCSQLLEMGSVHGTIPMLFHRSCILENQILINQMKNVTIHKKEIEYRRKNYRKSMQSRVLVILMVSETQIRLHNTRELNKTIYMSNKMKLLTIKNRKKLKQLINKKHRKNRKNMLLLDSLVRIRNYGHRMIILIFRVIRRVEWLLINLTKKK